MEKRRILFFGSTTNPCAFEASDDIFLKELHIPLGSIGGLIGNGYLIANPVVYFNKEFASNWIAEGNLFDEIANGVYMKDAKDIIDNWGSIREKIEQFIDNQNSKLSLKKE